MVSIILTDFHNIFTHDTLILNYFPRHYEEKSPKRSKLIANHLLEVHFHGQNFPSNRLVKSVFEIGTWSSLKGKCDCVSTPIKGWGFFCIKRNERWPKKEATFQNLRWKDKTNLIIDE